MTGPRLSTDELAGNYENVNGRRQAQPTLRNRNERETPVSTSTGTPRCYRKKPVEIEAMQYLPNDSESTDALMHFLEGCTGWRMSDAELGIVIPTLEGDHLARPGDWIIKGVKGEFYPCKPDIFQATYEPA